MTKSQLKEIRERFADREALPGCRCGVCAIPALLAHIDALEARVKELEADGKRLDWLQGVIRHEIEPPEHYEDDVLKASLRQAIDAAIKASEGGNNE